MADTGKPTRTAIALVYDGETTPRITAKGRGALAEEIVAAAKQHGIPLKENDELTALLAQLDLGAEIPRELYVAVAEVIAFAYVVTGKFPKHWCPQDEATVSGGNDASL